MSAITTPTRALGRRRPSIQVLCVIPLAAVALLVPAVFGSDNYAMSIATTAVIYALVTVTLNLLVGFGGQISLGHAGLLAVGGYAGAELGTHVSGVPFPLEILAAGLVTAIVGFFLGLPTGRLRGHYLAILTLGFGLIVPQIALNWSSFTGGREGLLLGTPGIAGLNFGGSVSFYYATLVVVAIALALILLILASSSGRAFTAVRDSEAAAAAMGVNVRRTRVLLFTTSAFFAGVAGDLAAHLQGIVSPDSFPFSLSLFFLAACVVGGLASVWGSVIAGAAFAIVDSQTSGTGGLEPVIIGGIVVVLLLLSPGGLAEIPRRLRNADRLLSRNRRAIPVRPVVGKERNHA
jgi:branched-chain amino acid transport system permease protein